MTEILIVLCGGTIGSYNDNGEIKLGGDLRLTVAEKYMRGKSDVHFTVTELCSVSSEEITDKFYMTLISYFRNLDLTGYDGVIITHGTDTLSFTAPLFSFVFRDVKIPVIFVSANFVPQDIRSNAHRNFSDAVSVIKSGIKGVFCVSDGEAVLASRLTEADWLDNRFGSFDGKPVMKTENDAIEIADIDLIKEINLFDAKRLNVTTLDKKIMMITPFTGIDYDSFDIEKAEAVLHLLYHSGTACSEQLVPFIEKCKNRGKDFYIAPVKHGDMYTSTLKLTDCGAIPIFNTSREASLAKLKIAYNMNIKNFKEFVDSNLYFEQIEG